MIKILSSLIAQMGFIFLVSLTPSTYAKEIFPISSLGSCRDMAECRWYCSIPHHTPACWAYAASHRNVLGEEDSLTPVPTISLLYPIPSLGNCDSKQACKTYCEDLSHHEACSTYAKEKGISAIIRQSPIEKEILVHAKTYLGCTDQEHCRLVCEKPDMKSSCQTFAKTYKLSIKPRKKPSRVSAESLLTVAKQQLGCETKEACKEHCSDTQNISSCSQLMSQIEDQLSPTPPIKQPCTQDDSCNAFCTEHPDQCPSFTSSFGMMIKKGEPVEVGSFIGPSGCTTAEECETYCTIHPTECPDFFQHSKFFSTVSPSPFTSNPDTLKKNIPEEETDMEDLNEFAKHIDTEIEEP